MEDHKPAGKAPMQDNPGGEFTNAGAARRIFPLSALSYVL